MVKVRALERGYYAGIVRDEGEVFDFIGPGKRPSWTELVAFGGKGDHDGDGLTGGSKPKSDAVDLSSRTVSELRSIAEGQGIDLTGLSRKSDIIAAIEAGSDNEPSEVFGDAPEPQTVIEAQREAGGIEPDWVPKEHQPVAVTD